MAYRCARCAKVAFLLGLLVPGCGDQPPFFPASEFWRPLPASVEVAPESPAFIADLLKTSQGGKMHINLDAYGVALVSPPRGTLRIDVPLSQQNASLKQVPLPLDARPAPGSDGHLVVLDSERGLAHEFWQLARKGTGFVATYGTTFPLEGDGIGKGGNGVRGSGLSLLLGLLTFDEMQGRTPLRHALAWAFFAPNSGYFVAPASASDGYRRGRPGSIPEGARLQLDPSLDLGTLGLSPAGRILAQAMQQYGLFCVDTSEGATLYAEAGKQWQGVLDEEDARKIPVEKLRVLRLGPRIPIQR